MKRPESRWATAIILLGAVPLLYVGSLMVIARIPMATGMGSPLATSQPRYIHESISFSGAIRPSDSAFHGSGWINIVYRPLLRAAGRKADWQPNFVAGWILGFS